MLGSAENTAYDLRFRLLNIPVRIHPLFWLVMLFISGLADIDLKLALVFVACAFLSILVHEYGHGLAGRWMRVEPSEIVLYSMGGYCAIDQDRLSPWRRVFMLIAGPGAGFLLYGLVFAFELRSVGELGRLGRAAVHFLLYINLWWGILNLFPLWPLDGGQILGNVLGMVNRRHGMRWTHVIALLTAGGLAIWKASNEQYWMAFWFGYFALINYQRLQALHYTYGTFEDPRW